MITIACHRKKLACHRKNWVRKDDFDDGRIRKPQMPTRNLLGNINSLPQEKKFGEKSATVNIGFFLNQLNEGAYLHYG